MLKRFRKIKNASYTRKYDRGNEFHSVKTGLKWRIKQKKNVLAISTGKFRDLYVFWHPNGKGLKIIVFQRFYYTADLYLIPYQYILSYNLQLPLIDTNKIKQIYNI